MANHMPRNPSHCLEDTTCIYSREMPLYVKPKWYFSKKEIDEQSPSRKDGIDCEYESHLRQLYCSYLRDLGIELKVPQVTIATATVLCHRFYMHQSHSKNHWQTIANSCMFLASKAEDTPRWLKDIIVVAYKLMYRWDPLAPQKIRQKEIYDKQKQLILLGEQLVLVTVGFDLNIEHPYKPLAAALKILGITQKEVTKVAWNFVNDWLRTTLCLQYKPHYIAAGSLFLAAKLQKLKLPSSNGKTWWMQFDVSPKPLEEVIQHLLQLLGSSSSSKQPMSTSCKEKGTPECVGLVRKRKLSGSELCRSTVEQGSTIYSTDTAVISKCPIVESTTREKPKADNENCLSDSGSADSIVEDGDAELRTGPSNQESSCQIVSVQQKIDINKIRERMKKRKLDRVEAGKPVKDDEISGEAWIERELERGVELMPSA